MWLMLVYLVRSLQVIQHFNTEPIVISVTGLNWETFFLPLSDMKGPLF